LTAAVKATTSSNVDGHEFHTRVQRKERLAKLALVNGSKSRVLWFSSGSRSGRAAKSSPVVAAKNKTLPSPAPAAEAFLLQSDPSERSPLDPLSSNMTATLLADLEAFVINGMRRHATFRRVDRKQRSGHLRDRAVQQQLISGGVGDSSDDVGSRIMEPQNHLHRDFNSHNHRHSRSNIKRGGNVTTATAAAAAAAVAGGGVVDIRVCFPPDIAPSHMHVVNWWGEGEGKTRRRHKAPEGRGIPRGNQERDSQSQIINSS
jgi:hypothetical protein